MEVCNIVSHLTSVNTFVLRTSDHELSSFLRHKNNLCRPMYLVFGALSRSQRPPPPSLRISEALVLALEAGIIQTQPIRGQYPGHVISIDQSEARNYPSSALGGGWVFCFAMRIYINSTFHSWILICRLNPTTRILDLWRVALLCLCNSSNRLPQHSTNQHCMHL